MIQIFKKDGVFAGVGLRPAPLKIILKNHVKSLYVCNKIFIFADCCIVWKFFCLLQATIEKFLRCVYRNINEMLCL